MSSGSPADDVVLEEHPEMDSEGSGVQGQHHCVENVASGGSFPPGYGLVNHSHLAEVGPGQDSEATLPPDACRSPLPPYRCQRYSYLAAETPLGAGVRENSLLE